MPDFAAATRRLQPQTDDDPRLARYLLPRHLEWIRRPDQTPSQAAVDHALRVFYGEDIPARAGDQVHRFSASGIGGKHGVGFACWRKSLFSYAGWSKLPLTAEEIDNMAIGNACHLTWQMEGLSAGYFTSCETWDYATDFSTGGKDDGILDDGSLAELKFTKGEKFDKILKGDRQYAQPPGPQTDHVFQVRLLMKLKDLEYASLVYVDREKGRSTEFRIRRDEASEADLQLILEDLNDYADRDVLPKMLPRCTERRGWMFEHCAYRDRCPAATSLWPPQ